MRELTGTAKGGRAAHCWAHGLTGPFARHAAAELGASVGALLRLRTGRAPTRAQVLGFVRAGVEPDRLAQVLARIPEGGSGDREAVALWIRHQWAAMCPGARKAVAGEFVGAARRA